MRKGRLGRYKQDRLIEYFVSEPTAPVVATLCCVNRKTAAFSSAGDYPFGVGRRERGYARRRD